MDNILLNPKTFYDVYVTHCESLKALHNNSKHDVTAGIRTASIRYTLPKWGFPLPSRNKLTAEDIKAGLEFMKTIPISELTNALAYQQEVFDSLGNVPSSRNYRYHLNKMLVWCHKQSWWENAVKTDANKYCPAIRLQRGRVSDKVRVTNKKMTPKCSNFKYGLKFEEITPESQQELDNFLNFQTTLVGGRKRQDAPLRHRSAMAHVKNAKRLLGWLHRYKGVPLEELNLKLLVSASGLTKEGHRDEDAIDKVIDLVDEHLQWLRDIREALPNTELKCVESLVAVAKFLYHKESKYQSREQVASKRVGYRDIPIIEELRRLECEIMARVNTAPPRSDESKKWVDWPTYKACIERLISECAPLDKKGKKRTNRTLAQSHQIALICMLLSAFPDRSRTIRELEVGRTLINRDGKWFVEHTAEDFKTGNSFCKNGQKRVVELPQTLYPLLEEWLSKWRSVFNPNHPYVFTQLNGKPLTDGSVYQYFRKRIYRLTGQAFTPHMVRDSIVTYLKLSGTSDQVLAALAELMAHSQKMQHQIYDRRTPEQKVAPALSALQSLPTGNLPPPPPLKTIELTTEIQEQ
ncbi:MAG: site-specific integrase [Nostoc sp. DedQUE04]|uniref:site-specific integrase n=1 Tax=Nostoc sp. DedQUE04 TaxID=3075390 RepID=UPI002AD59484|nr:site-specific integrase [Nostoc sp. DedQUE04]MDZ8139007.1 site-specific integrase [Nostoc sp. DedQUE04]